MPTIPTIPPEIYRTLMLQGSLLIGVLFAYLALKVIHLRMTIKGKVVCCFQEADGNMSFELIRYQQEARDSEPVIISNDLGYRMDIKLQGRINYPMGATRFMQENVPLQCYVRGYVDPIDWYTKIEMQNPLALAVMYKNAKNTAFATDWLGALAQNIGGVSLKKFQTLMVIGLCILGIGLGGVGYMSFQNYRAMQSISSALGK